mmetsp:Transcript_44645/g.148977  ORF Transcript_44645/g.148977 Transcript_44645/m.148977 type:complete len:343 (-) Transcript_44645:692-1720(-)
MDSAAFLDKLMAPDSEGRAPAQRDKYAAALANCDLMATARAAAQDPSAKDAWGALKAAKMSKEWLERARTTLARLERGEGVWRVWLDGWSGKAGASCAGFYLPFPAADNEALEDAFKAKGTGARVSVAGGRVVAWVTDEATPDGGWRQMSAADETIWREVERWEASPAPSSRPEASSSAPEAQDEEAAAISAKLGSLKVAELRALLEGGGVEVAGKKATKAALLQQIEAAVTSGALTLGPEPAAPAEPEPAAAEGGRAKRGRAEPPERSSSKGTAEAEEEKAWEKAASEAAEAAAAEAEEKAAAEAAAAEAARVAAEEAAAEVAEKARLEEAAAAEAAAARR